MPAPPDYNDVPTRIKQFREKYPEGTLRCADVSRPYSIEVIEGASYVVYVAAAFRTPDDPAPGIGTAWEPVPGPTNFTKGSEIQNAETSAWGRAIIAVGAADAKRIASDEEIQGSRARSQAGAPQGGSSKDATKEQLHKLIDGITKLLPAPGYPPDWVAAGLPSLPGLKGVLAGDYGMTHDEAAEGLKILEATA